MRYSVGIFFLFSKDYSSALRKYVILMAQLHHSPQNIFVTKSHTCVALTLIFRSVRSVVPSSFVAGPPPQRHTRTHILWSWQRWNIVGQLGLLATTATKEPRRNKKWRKIKQFSCVFNAFVIADELYSPSTTRWPHAVRANCDINHILCETMQTTTLAHAHTHAHTAHDTSAHTAHILRANYLIPLNCLLILHVYTSTLYTLLPALIGCTWRLCFSAAFYCQQRFRSWFILCNKIIKQLPIHRYQSMSMSCTCGMRLCCRHTCHIVIRVLSFPFYRWTATGTRYIRCVHNNGCWRLSIVHVTRAHIWNDEWNTLLIFLFCVTPQFVMMCGDWWCDAAIKGHFRFCFGCSSRYGCTYIVRILTIVRLQLMRPQLAALNHDINWYSDEQINVTREKERERVMLDVCLNSKSHEIGFGSRWTINMSPNGL